MGLFFQIFLISLGLFWILPRAFHFLYAVGIALGGFFFCLLTWVSLNSRLPSSFLYFSCELWFQYYPVCFGVDAINFFFLLLTSLVFVICILASRQSVKKNFSQYLFLLLVLEFLLFLTFTVFDFFLFYIFFEALLIPMFLMIGFWGSNLRRIKAAYYLFLYTLFGSLFLLLSLILLGFQTGTFNWYFLFYNDLSIVRELLLWPGIFLAFAIKVPMFPFHIWLPEAHVEAPTGGSIILASLLLKLGAFGFLRFLLPLFPYGTSFYASVVVIFAVLGVFYASFVAIRQIDLKRIIAYSSVAHMNFGIIGLFSLTIDGLVGSFYLMLGHGIVSGALFYLIGVLYDRYKTRVGLYYGGLALRMPLFCSFFFFFSVANIAFPGTINYVAELLVFLGLGLSNVWVLALALGSLFGTTLFTFWLYNRVAFGAFRVLDLGGAGSSRAAACVDLSFLEFLILCFFTGLTLVGGLFPMAVLGLLDGTFFYYFN